MRHAALDACVNLVVFAAVVGVAIVIGLRWVRRTILGDIAQRLTRAQHQVFVSRLRELIFKDPFAYMNMLCSNEAKWFVDNLWKEVGDTCARPSLRGGGSMEALEMDGSAAPHPARLSPDGLGVELFRMHDGLVLAVVKVPPPKLSGEAYLIGILLPADPSLERDINRARKQVRFFVLNRWESGRNTDFCEWKPNGKQLTYNIGAPKDPQGFAKAIEARRQEDLRYKHAKSSRRG
jgi:hypothetical protein